MFIYKNHIWQSDIFPEELVSHGFSTREGGKSREDHLKSMNCGFFRGDDESTVLENISLLCSYAGCSQNVTVTPQIHSTKIRVVTKENAGEGITRDVPYPCDGFITEESGITLLIRVADCAPVLCVGIKRDKKVIVGAFHAGWRGAAGGIAKKGVNIIKEMGAEKIYAAIGACIHSCCYEVGEDMKSEAAKYMGVDVADSFIRERNGRLYADIVGINRYMLSEAGVDRIDICPECTCCNPKKYHSHRATGGKRGTMGAVIGIK